jgi:hypothetical protein
MATQVQVKITKVYCGDTEDVGPTWPIGESGSEDEFYMMSALSDGTPDHTQAAVIGRFHDDIDDHESRYPNQFIFQASVPTDAVIRGGIEAFDEDFRKAWDRKPEWVAKLKDAVVTGLTSSGDPKAATAGQIIKWGYAVANLFARLDKDDKLGTIELNIPARGPEYEKKVWRFAKGDGNDYSSWDYTVDIDITRAATPPYVVQGAIRAKWEELGGPTSFLGYPVTDELPTPDGRGRYNHFEASAVGGSSIYWTPETGAHEVHGLIRAKWAELRWEQSTLGYPTSDETDEPDGSGRYNTFERGSLHWSNSTNEVTIRM